MALDPKVNLRQLVPQRPQPRTLSWGEVIDDSPLTVQFRGTALADATTAVAAASGYTPVVGDIVEVALVGTSWIVRGTIT